MRHTVTKAAAIVALLISGMAAPVLAGEDNTLHSWQKKASQSIDTVMYYPAMALRRNKEGFASFRVTIDRSGDVVESEQLERPRNGLINGAAKNVLRKAEFPALPTDYDGETLTFALNLNYAIASSALQARSLKRNLEREGRVTGREIVSRSGPLTASIELLEGGD